jgi:predicted Rossmann fold flavoprotein
MNPGRNVIVGGGAAGFFAAIACAEADPRAEVLVIEKTSQFLAKVRISGGGRCNVTHHCFDALDFVRAYPRGQRELIGPFQRFQARDIVAWFAGRGVELKAESDGRMFPVTDSSQTIVDCLLHSARAAGVKFRSNCGVESAARRSPCGFELTLSGGEQVACDRLLLATGGCRTPALASTAVALGHTLEPPVPSLFTFQIASPLLADLAGLAVDPVEVSVPGTALRERGPVLVTHAGLSGPVVLRLSAWGARRLHAMDYRFPLRVNWLPQFTPDTLAAELRQRRQVQGAKLLLNTPIAPLPARLWERLVSAAGVPAQTRCAALSRAAEQALQRELFETELSVMGKSLNRGEFVTCGGVRLREVNFKTMESRVCPGLFLAGELLDIDGLTGGFNFQSAWTTGWIAGNAMAAAGRASA